MSSLLKFKSNTFSQNGEDGIIYEIMKRLKISQGVCCEFGAWDGIHLSNCRNLILQGWSALMIEGLLERYLTLVETYKDSNKVKCVNAYVGTDGNSLSEICKRESVNELDFLSIDIDGLDYSVWSRLDIKPKVVCVEVNAGHDPNNSSLLSEKIAASNVGQSLGAFYLLAVNKGYDLVAYNGNAFFVRTDVNLGVLNPITPLQAYNEFISFSNKKELGWLYLVNKGLVNPFFKFNNELLSGEVLKLGFLYRIKLYVQGVLRKIVNKFSG